MDASVKVTEQLRHEAEGSTVDIQIEKFVDWKFDKKEKQYNFLQRGWDMRKMSLTLGKTWKKCGKQIKN